MTDRERQLDSLEQRLRQWGASEQARHASVPPMRALRGPSDWPWWTWGAPAAAASVALVVGLVVLFQIRTGPSSEQLAQNATTLTSLRAQYEELEGELQTLNEAHRAMLDSQIALKDDLALSRKRIV